MESDLQVWQLILNASWMVKFVMLVLLLASVASWMIIFRKRQILAGAEKSANKFEERFWSGTALNQLYEQVSRKAGDGGGLEQVFSAGFSEFSRLREQGRMSDDRIVEGAERAMRVAMTRESDELEHHLSFLATVGSTSPYIGLFGTVWGIMNSFRGLAMVQQATLATVAPGISEALVATAMGLFAAIPAVLAFNRFAAQAEVIAGQYQTFSEEFSGLLHRQLHAQ